MKLSWKSEGRVRLGSDQSGWVRAVVLKEASWVVLAPLGIPGYRVEELFGYDSVADAKTAAQVIVDRAIGTHPKGGAK